MILLSFMYSVAIAASSQSDVVCIEGQRWDSNTCSPRICLNGVIVTQQLDCPVDAPCIAGRCCETCKEEVEIDKWITKNGLNKYGDGKGTMYTGGTPLYDEASGYALDRYDYIRQAHPDHPWHVSGAYRNRGYGDVGGSNMPRRPQPPARPAQPTRPYYFMGCQMIYRKERCIQYYPQCSWINDEGQWMCTEPKEVESGKDYWAYRNARDAGVPGYQDYLPRGVQNGFNRVVDPEAYGEIMEGIGELFPQGIPDIGGFNSGTFDYSNIGGTGFNPMAYMNCDAVRSRDMCNRTPSCTWIFDDSMMRCKETKEIESHKQYWTTQGAAGSVPPEMQPGGAGSGSFRHGGMPPRSGMSGMPPRPRPRPRPYNPYQPRQPMRPGVGMGGAPPSPGAPGMGFSPNQQMPFFMVDCEMIHTAKQCYQKPMCSWIMDDSMWVCLETKEVETSKHFWQITNANQGRMPGPIPGTHGYGGMPGPNAPPNNLLPPPANRPPANRSPTQPTTNSGETGVAPTIPSSEVAGEVTNPEPAPENSESFGPGAQTSPGFQYSNKLQKALKQSASSKPVSTEPSLWVYLAVALVSFMVGASLVCVARNSMKSMRQLRSLAQTKEMGNEFVKLGEGRAV